MNFKAIVHEEDGRYWAEVPAIPGCATYGDTMDDLRSNLREAIEACLSVDLSDATAHSSEHVIEIAV